MGEGKGKLLIGMIRAWLRHVGLIDRQRRGWENHTHSVRMTIRSSV